MIQRVDIRNIRKNSRAYKILKYLALGSGFIILSTISPYGGARVVKSLIQNYLRRKRFEKYRFLTDLKNLQKRDLIDYQDLGNGNVKIIITARGKQKVLLNNIDEIKLKKQKRWDGKWRLIIFDIPHSRKGARDAFRKILKNLGFYPLQKSVFITPYPCENEIDFIASIFDIRQNVLLLYVNNFEGEEKLKYHFKIK